MRSVSVRLEDLKTMILNLGFAGENEHTRVTVDCKKMYDQYPSASASLTVQPPEGEAYPAIIERDGDYVIWDVTDSDLIAEGSGEMQLSFTQEPHLAKSYICRFRVGRSLLPTGDAPDPLNDFLTRAGAAVTAIPETINSALEAAKESGEFDGPPGPAGQDGADGQDGFSPVVEVSAITGGHRVSVTDAEGTETFDVMDGEDGQDGQDGAPGQDGVTPNVQAGTTTTLPAGSSATVERRSGSPDSAPVFDFGIPQGIQGEPGEVSEAELQAVADAKADIIKDVVDTPASVMSLPDGGNGYPMKMQFRLDPIQEGTGDPDPSPENVRPIRGHTGVNVSRTGVNVWDEEWENGAIASDGTVNSTTYPNRITTSFIPLCPGATYYIPPACRGGRYAIYDASKTLILADIGNGLTTSAYTAPSGASFIRITLESAYGSTYNNDISINYPATDTSYHSGTSNATYPISWQTEAGTVYGGHVRDNGDGTGTLTVDTAIYTFDGTNNAVNAMSDIGTYKFFSKTNFIVPAPNTTASNDPPTLWCDTYKAKGAGGLGAAFISGSYFRICADPSFESVEEFNTWLESHNVTFVYKLTTPVTYNLTMGAITSILGQNNIWVDNGTMESVEYFADTKLYVNKKIKAAQDLIMLIITANREDEMKATRAYSSGDLLIVNGTLYKALTTIANGATLTNGTNVDATTIATELAELA